MQYRVYNRNTLAYIDGGAVRDYNIDGDYINNNNSTIDIIKPTKANVGDIVCLIKDTGAYDKGVVTSADNEALQICYKGDKELFNDNFLNPLASEFENDTDIKFAGKFGVGVVANLIDLFWGRNIDEYKRLPLSITTDGDVLDEDGNVKMLWKWDNTEIAFVDWLVELFTSYSLIVKWDITFDTAQSNLALRNARYNVIISAVNNDIEIIKDNVAMQTITYAKEELPNATVCVVVDKSTKEILTTSNGKNMFDTSYGYEDSYLNDQGQALDISKINYSQESRVSNYISVNSDATYTLSMRQGDNKDRLIAFYDQSKNCIGIIENPYSGGTNRFSITFTTPSNTKYIRVCYPKNAKEIQLELGNNATGYDAYTHKAIYYLCQANDGTYYLTFDSTDSNRMLPVKTKYVEYDGDSEDETILSTAKDTLMPNTFNQAIEIEIPRDSKMFDFELANFGDVYKIITKNGTIKSVYSGRKENSSSNIITLLFGLGRKNYTDLIQMSMREGRYTRIYR